MTAFGCIPLVLLAFLNKRAFIRLIIYDCLIFPFLPPNGLIGIAPVVMLLNRKGRFLGSKTHPRSSPG
jgi:hypothetical protein